jgi:DinB family
MLMVTPQLMQLHFDYSAWASARLVGAAAELSPEELNRDFGTSDKSVLGTLVHVFAADRLWMARVEGGEMAKFISPADHDLVVLLEVWPALYLQMEGLGGLAQRCVAGRRMCIQRHERQSSSHAAVADRAARGESCDAPSRASVGVFARAG